MTNQVAVMKRIATRTTEKDQQVLTQLRNAPHLIDAVIERASHASDVTPELVNELANAHSPLLDGAL